MEKDIKLQALSATARAYFDRGVYVQYDQLFLNRSGSVREERRQKGMPPEYATRQNTLHLDCSSFVYSVYYQTFGLELEADQTAELIDLENIRVFYHVNTYEETKEQRDAIKKAFLDELRPGDAVICRHQGEKNGHIMLHVGDGNLLHCTYRVALGGGDYSYVTGVDKREPYGGIEEAHIEDFFKEEADGTPKWGSYFSRRETRFAILRPYGEDTPVLPSAIARVNGMQNLVAEKTCSVFAGKNVKPGDEIEYFVEVFNKDTVVREVEVTDTIPEGTELVRGETCKKMLLAPYQKGSFSYTVKVVDANRDLIVADKCVINGFTLCPLRTLVGNHLSREDKKAIAQAAANCDCESKWLFAKEVYKTALGKVLPWDSAKEAMANMLCESQIDTQVVIPDRSGMRAMLIPNMYGGKNMQTNSEFAPVRAREVRACDLEAGDIILFTEDGTSKTSQVWLCTGEGKFASCIGNADGVKAQVLLESLLSKHSFFVLRPAQAI
ncbi:MAG: C40 family peptidase [Clostridia bacterium]|nr:C40 family peptidase [Clostridia bacterium]